MGDDDALYLLGVLIPSSLEEGFSRGGSPCDRLCIAEVLCLCVVHLIMTRVRATIRVEGTATSDELVVVRAVQVNAQVSGR